jgi:peptidyl-tRNA hydrolase
VRIGIDRPPNRQYDVAAYVLSKFTHEEQQKLDDILEEVEEMVKNLLC